VSPRAQADAEFCHAQVVFCSSVHHKGPVHEGMMLNVRDIAQAPRITIDEPQVEPLHARRVSILSDALAKPQSLTYAHVRTF